MNLWDFVEIKAAVNHSEGSIKMKRKTRKWSYGMIAFVLAANTWTSASVPMAVYAETAESNTEEQTMEVEHAESSQEELLTIEEIRGSVDSEGDNRCYYSKA